MAGMMLLLADKAGSPGRGRGNLTRSLDDGSAWRKL
jgi:hypothetical protein